jgi:hypothetical protein
MGECSSLATQIYTKNAHNPNSDEDSIVCYPIQYLASVFNLSEKSIRNYYMKGKKYNNADSIKNLELKRN